MFDAATLREEMAVIEAKLRVRPNDPSLVNRYISYARQLRKMEYEDNGYVEARSSVTGY